MRKTLSALLALLVLTLAASCACAQEEALYYKNPETGFFATIDDGAGLLNDSECAAALNQMKEITAYWSVGLYTTGGGSTYISAKAKDWGDRTFGKNADRKRKLYNGMIKCDLFMYYL